MRTPEHVKWVSREWECHDPNECLKHVFGVLKSEALSSDLFMGIAGLALIAANHGDKAGANACADTLMVLANAHKNIDRMRIDKS